MTSYTYSVLGQMLTETQPAPFVVPPLGGSSLPAPVTNYVYDPDSNLISTTLATASPQETTSTVYDATGRVVKTINPDGTYTTDEYDSVGNLVYSTDAMGRVTQYIYNSRDEQIATIRPDGSVLTTEYDGGGRIVATTDANGNMTQYVYDKLGRQTEEIQPDPDASGPTTTTTVTTYVDSSDRTYVTNAEGAAQALADGATAATLSNYIANHLVSFIDYTTETDCDKLRRTIEVIQPSLDNTQATQAITQYGYDDDGNLKTVTDPRGFVTTYYYDESNRKIAEEDAVGNYTWYFYDADSNLQYVVNANGANGPSPPATVSGLAGDTTQYVYDDLNRKIAEIDPATPCVVDGVTETVSPTTSYAYLCSCQPGGTDFLRPSGERLSKGSGLFSFSHKSMAA